MSDKKIELVFCYVPRRHAQHQLNGLASALDNAFPGKRHSRADIKDLFAALIDSGRVDLLRTEHHDHEFGTSVFVSIDAFRNIMVDSLNHHGTLKATGGVDLDLVARPELLVTNFARHSHEDWAIKLRKDGIPTCVGINGHENNRRPRTIIPRRKRGVSIN